MIRLMSCELEKFSPAEAEQITGLSPAVQRVWRQRGIIPSSGGKVASFDVFDLARMLFLRLMSERGIGPADITRDPIIIETSVRRIVFDALTYGAAYGDGYPEGGSLDAFILARMPAEEVFEKAGDGDSMNWLASQLDAATKNDEMARRIAYDGAPRVIAAPLFFWFADGEPYWDSPLGRRLNHELSTSGSDGPIILMILPKIGKLIVDRAGRPLVRITED